MKNLRLFCCLGFCFLLISNSLINAEGLASKRKETSENIEAPTPNILFIFGDQWRRMALSIYKDNADYNQGDPVKTPNIDALVREGVIYDNSYCTAPLCCPNRASMLTGKYTYNHGLTDNVHADDFTLDNVTIAHILAEKGYDTGYLGKWHLANHHKKKNVYLNKEERRGFQYWYGNEMCHNHFDGIFMHCSDEIDTYYDKKLPNKFKPSVNYPKDIQQLEKWMPDHLTRKAVEYLENTYDVRDTQKPFVCYLSYSPPHTIHGPVPKATATGEESYSIAGEATANGKKVNYGKTGRMKGSEFKVWPNTKAAPNEYRAPNDYEADYRQGGKFDGTPLDLGKRPNVSDYYYQHSVTAYPGYFGAVNSLDYNIGKVIKTLQTTDDVRNPGHKLIDNTIIVVTADHGEHMGAHDAMGKGSFYEEASGVPLVFYWKDRLAKNLHKKTIINSIDVAPTLLGALNIEKPKYMDGADLSEDLLSKEAGEPNQYAFMRLSRWIAVRHQQYVYAYDPRIQKKCMLFDLEKDPFQMNPIMKGQKMTKAQAAMSNHLHDKLAQYIADANDVIKLPK